MRLGAIDWVVILVYFLLNIAVGLYFRRKAGTGTGEFFVSGRDAAWWLAGTSMVATTFSADTPLAVTGLVANNGIAGNWLWWNYAFSGMMTVFLFARLWRRSEVITDVELVELRYSGGSAAFLRGFRAIYFGVFMSSIIMGWINLAMAKVILTTMGIEKKEAILLCLPIMFIAMLYSSLSGLRGVLWTSLFQFVLMMGMTILLGIYSVKAVGGLAAMKEKLTALDAVRVAEGGSGSIMDFFPSFNSAWLPFTAFFVFIAVNWWATWYPGAEPGGGGYVAQRIFCAKDEKHSLWATMWFNVAHYALRPWPWILTALASVILYPELTDKEVGFIRMMTDHMPPALRGLMLASFLAAYMSTIATHLNWGASYFVNDFYQRFLAPNRSERHYVAISRLATLGLMMIGGGVSFFLESVADAWQLLINIGAGTGAVYLLRWYWWRINAWSEIAAMSTAAFVAILLQVQFGLNPSENLDFAHLILITVSITSVVWIAVTFLTSPVPKEKLLEFYRRTRPTAAGWQPIAMMAPEIPPDREGWYNLKYWLLGCAMVYLSMFSIGKFLLGDTRVAGLLALGAIVAGYWLYRDFSRRGWARFGE